MSRRFIALDAEDEPTLWRGTEDDPAPRALVRRCDVGAEVWDLISQAVSR